MKISFELEHAEQLRLKVANFADSLSSELSALDSAWSNLDACWHDEHYAQFATEYDELKSRWTQVENQLENFQTILNNKIKVGEKTSQALSKLNSILGGADSSSVGKKAPGKVKSAVGKVATAAQILTVGVAGGGGAGLAHLNVITPDIQKDSLTSESSPLEKNLCELSDKPEQTKDVDTLEEMNSEDLGQYSEDKERNSKTKTDNDSLDLARRLAERKGSRKKK